MMSTPGRNETKNEKNGQEVKQSLSGVRKPRFKWTVQVHGRFVDAVNQLGGIYTTPKNIMRLMDIEQITTDHIKSHLQKYRLNGSKQANTNTRKSKKCFHEFSGELFKLLNSKHEEHSTYKALYNIILNFRTMETAIRATVFQRHQEHKYSITPGLHTMGSIQVSDVPEISTERQRTSQTKLEQFERAQQQVQYIEREYHGTLKQTSNNEKRQYPQVEEMELTTEQLDEQRKMAQKDHISILNSDPLSSPMESTNYIEPDYVGTTYSTLEIERKNFLKPSYKRCLEAHKEKGKFPYTSARTDDRELIIPEKKRFDAAPLKISLQMEKGSTSSGFSADETHERGKCYQVYASPTSAAQIEAQNMVAVDNKINMSNFPSYKDLKAMNASNEKSFDLNMPAKEQEE
ncbi:PREDICTED: protein PHOSPHATE STARVATION RESPONSE 3-like isoform X4 [Ipomoea nil]|uniref:protein PHOSPHATE STARVATION RESPONSE 3-like isoform X4 n=1 Tax=Ipomoea nil TaxID=35883 RepID=UPI000901038B|nr:PREDICTED: protein PHOSPHATE STARVATION RESPONSE 3-like isoform X4 [Ipomoea nil]